MPLPFVVNWYGLYGPTVDALCLTSIVVRHATALLRAAAAVRADQDVNKRHNVVFEERRDKHWAKGTSGPRGVAR